MRTLQVITVGDLAVVLRSDGVAYLANAGVDRFVGGAMRIGSSPVVCQVLVDALRQTAERQRQLDRTPSPPTSTPRPPSEEGQP